jgi:lysophospholipase L1-like esterase
VLRFIGVQLVVVVVLLAGIEGVLRAVVYRDRSFQTPLSRFSPVLGWEKVPLAEVWSAASDHDVKEVLNSKGLHDYEIDYVKPMTERRVLFLGDSFTESYTVPLRDGFIKLAEQQVGQAVGSRTLRLINAGTRGYGTDQELLYFRTEGRRFQPDLVILMFYVNDLEDNATSRGGAKPQFGIRDGQLVLESSPQMEVAARPRTIGDTASEQWRGPARGLIDLAQRTATYRFVVQRLIHQLPVLDAMLGGAGARRTVVPSVYAAFRDEDSEEIERGWRLTQALLRQLASEVRDAGADLIVVNIPDRVQVHEEYQRQLLQTGAGSDGISTWDFDLPRRRLGSLCADLGLPFVDLTDTFRISAQAGRRLYLPRDPHWNAAGHRLAAETLTPVILEYFRPRVAQP